MYLYFCQRLKFISPYYVIKIIVSKFIITFSKLIRKFICENVFLKCNKFRNSNFNSFTHHTVFQCSEFRNNLCKQFKKPLFYVQGTYYNIFHTITALWLQIFCLTVIFNF